MAAFVAVVNQVGVRICQLLYASGGKALALFFGKANRVQYLNGIDASLMFGVALWMLTG